MIRHQEDVIAAFEKIFAQIDEGHATLDKNRNKLFDKKTIGDLFQTASDIKDQVDAVTAAFGPPATKK